MDSGFTPFESNSTVLPGIRSGEHLPEIIAGNLPLKLVPDLVRELTHHWCFFSPVGNILSILDQQRKTALIYGETGRSFVDMSFRYNCCMNFVRPIAEGLTLLVEQDVLPTRGRVRAQPLLILYFLSQSVKKHQISNYGEMDDIIKDILVKCRSSNELFDRKENLLSSGFDLKWGGGLPAYLGIKSVLDSLNNYGYDIDSELFVAYVRSYFFEDFELVSLLLDESIDTLNIGDVVSRYLYKRLNNLLNEDIGDGIRAYEKFIGNMNLIPLKDGMDIYQWQEKLLKGRETTHGLFVDNEKAAAGMVLYRNKIKTHFGNEFGVPSKIYNILLRYYAQRQYFCLASQKTDIQINEYQRAIVYHSGAPILSGPIIFDHGKGNYKGVCEVYINTIHIFKLYVVSTRAKNIIVYFSEQPPESVQEDVVTGFLGRDVILGAIQDLNKMSQDIVKKQDIFGAVEEILLKYFETCNKNIKQWAVKSVVGKNNISFQKQIEAKGLYGLFDNDLVLFKSFVEETMKRGKGQSIKKSDISYELIKKIREIDKAYDVKLEEIM